MSVTDTIADPASQAGTKDTPVPNLRDASLGQIVLVLQGGGALGAYQAGVYQAMHEAGIEPDWVIGTSIGAINAAIIAGNEPAQRLTKLREFWDRARYSEFTQALASIPATGQFGGTMATVASGVPSFFEPNFWSFFGPHASLGAEGASYYSTNPLRRTLAALIDPAALNSGTTRITVGAASVSTGKMRYFDSRDMPLSVEHVMASGALPPAFPAVRIDGELYWDGGIVSNTPVEAVFDDNPRRNGLVFSVHIWNPQGIEPDSIWKVMGRQKDIQYSSRSDTHIARQKQIHRLRHVISELVAKLPKEARAEVGALAAYGCVTRLHVVRLLAPPLHGEDHSKDIDFSSSSIRTRWERGYHDTANVLAQRPWHGEFDPLEGFILHEAAAGHMVKEG